MQEAYRPPHGKYSLYCSVSMGGTYLGQVVGTHPGQRGDTYPGWRGYLPWVGVPTLDGANLVTPPRAKVGR